MPDVREKLVELLGNLFCGDYGVNGCDSCKYNTEVMCSAYACADHLIANGVTIQRWIPVAERLPRSRGEVFVWRVTPSWRTYDIVRFTDCLEDVDDVEFKGQKRGGFYLYDSEYGIYETRDVTHWMPLPEAPKEDEDD